MITRTDIEEQLARNEETRQESLAVLREAQAVLQLIEGADTVLRHQLGLIEAREAESPAPQTPPPSVH